MIAGRDSNIKNLNLQVSVDEFAEMEIDVEVHDLDQLSSIISELSKKPMITKVDRVFG